jgi:hypothetical protein
MFSCQQVVSLPIVNTLTPIQTPQFEAILQAPTNLYAEVAVLTMGIKSELAVGFTNKMKRSMSAVQAVIEYSKRDTRDMCSAIVRCTPG